MAGTLQERAAVADGALPDRLRPERVEQVLRGRLARDPEVPLGGRDVLATRALNAVVVALAHHDRACLALVPPVDVVVAGLQLRRVLDVRGHHLARRPAAETLRGCRVLD